MKLTRIEGRAVVLECAGCKRTGLGGTEAYLSASSQEMVTPEEWYQDPLNSAPYCSTCAAKLVQEDPTRSVSQFYTDTTGTEVRPEILSEN